MIFLATILWQSPWMLPAAMATAAVVWAAVLLVYPAQVQESGARWRWMPAVLRAMTFGALAIAMLQPAVLRPRTAQQQGAVVVLVDRSRSMSVSDRGRSTADLVALAGGLGALPPGARKESAPGLRGQFEVVRARLEQIERARGELDYARLSGRGLAAAEAQLKDAVDALRDALDAVTLPVGAGSDLAARVKQLKQPPPPLNDAGTRAMRGKLTAALASLAADQARADERLFEEDPAVRTACARTNRLSRAGLVELGLTQSRTGLLFNLPGGAPVIGYSFGDEVKPVPSLAYDLRGMPQGQQSDVTGAVREVMRELHARDVQAIVLLSDGKQVGGEEPVNADLSALRAPVFAVGVAKSGQRTDVSITRMDVPPSARAGQSINVHVELRAVGRTPGEGVDVQLDSPDSRQVQRVIVGEDWTAAADFELTLSRPGALALTATALPVDGETSEENNRAQRWVKVGADPLRVTVLAGADSGRQFSALHEALSRAPWVSLREVNEAETYRLSPETITSQHVVILCDLPVDALSWAQWEALDTMVRQRGGSVILCAGAHLPGAYAGNTTAADWLPFDAEEKPSWQSWPGGDAHFRIGAERSGDARMMSAWGSLAPVSRIVPVHRLRPGVAPLLVERSNDAAVMTQVARGNGRVIFIGTDETWRWHGQAAGFARPTFWPTLLGRVAPEPYATVEANVWLDASDIAPRPGQPVTLRARLLDREAAPVDDANAVVSVSQDDEPITTVTLKGRGDGRYDAVLEGLPAGDYELRLEPPPDPSAEIPPAAAVMHLHVAENFEAELADLSGDDRLLRRMAESSGGRFVPLDQMSALPRLLAENREKQTPVVEYTLWDSPYLFGFVLACLCAEWGLRKKMGLA